MGNEDYYFVTQAAYMENKKMQYTGYFYMEGKWKLLSRIQASTDASENWSLSGLYSFVEQSTETQTTSERSALYGPSFMAQTDGKDFVQVDSATFGHGTLENHEHVNAWQAGANDDYAVGIATGGYVEQEVLRGKTFSYKKVNQPSLLDDFSSYIPCLNKASTTASIEACLKSTTSSNSPSTVPSLIPTIPPSTVPSLIPTIPPSTLPSLTPTISQFVLP